MRLTLFIPGTAPTEAAWRTALAREGLRLEGEHLRGPGVPFEVLVEHVSNDGHFGEAFALPTVGAALNKAIDGAPGALVLTMPVALDVQAQAVATLVEAIGRAGGLGVRVEQSKLGYPLARWVELVKPADPADLYRAAVIVLTDREGGRLKSCGMHVFSLPDAEIEAGWQGTLDVFNVFQLAEDPVLRTGETFAPDAQTPRRRIERWPDGGYPSDHSCHNPFGVWRFGPEGGSASKKGALELVFMPALVALLLASEERAGRALTRAEVEAIVEKGVCMTMEPRDAQKLERSRGYSDLDPEQAWDQWRAARGGLSRKARS
jgi:hypothetical protein